MIVPGLMEDGTELFEEIDDDIFRSLPLDFPASGGVDLTNQPDDDVIVIDPDNKMTGSSVGSNTKVPEKPGFEEGTKLAHMHQ